MSKFLLGAAAEKDMRIAMAFYFAIGAHDGAGQLRPTLENPTMKYSVHPIEVAEIVAGVPGVTSEQIMAALLHDTVEDTGVDIMTIRRLFGPLVALYVLMLTDVYTPEAYPTENRSNRKCYEALRFGGVPNEVKTIKLADGLSNTPSIAVNKPKFMPTYGPEKRMLLTYLQGGDPGLWKRLDECLTSYGY